MNSHLYDCDLLVDEPKKSQYSTGVQVIAWGKDKKEKTGYKKGYSPCVTKCSTYLWLDRWTL